MNRCSLSQVVLVVPLSTATKDARSPFLKSESFRLLGILFSRSGNQNGLTDLDKRGRESLKANSGDVLRSINVALQDEDMLKTKRAKDVLKSATKVVAFQKANPEAAVSKDLVELKDRLEEMKESTESSGVRSACEKAVGEVDDCLKVLNQGSGSKDKDFDSTKKKRKQKGKKRK